MAAVLKGRRRLKYTLTALLIIGLLVFPIAVNVSFIHSLMILVAIFAIIALGFDILAGYAGQVSLGQAAFVGLGGYATAYLTANLRWEPLLAMVSGLLLTLTIAYFIALATVRLQSYYFPLVTMGLSVIMEVFFISFRGITHGPSGFAGIPTFSVVGMAVETDLQYYYLTWGLALVFLFISYRIVNSSTGRAFRAVQRDELAASMMGIDVAKFKTKAFLISAAYASVGGSMLAHYTRFLSPDMVGLFTSFNIVTMTVVGGMGTLLGAFLGGALLRGLPEAFVGLKDYMLLINGFATVAVLVFWPQGLVGASRSVRRAWQEKARPPAGSRAQPPSAEASAGASEDR